MQDALRAVFKVWPEVSINGQHQGLHKQTHLSAGTELVAMTSVVPIRTWRIPRYTSEAYIAKAAGKNKPASLALFLEMEYLEVGYVLATNRVLAWTNSCWLFL